MATRCARYQPVGELACLAGTIGPAEEIFIPATDEGFLRGDGVFEVIRVYEGTPFALGEHLDRLERSAANLRLGYEPPRDVLAAEVVGVAKRRAPAYDGLIRIVLTRGGRRLVMS